MRLLLLVTLGLVLWTGELPMKISIAALAALWLPSLRSTSAPATALARGYMRIPETAHYELLTMEIYTRALRCIVRPGKTAFKVTPKQGRDGGGLDAVRKLHLVLFCTVLLATGTLLRLLDLAGVGPLPDMPGIAAVIVPLLGLFELRRLGNTLWAVGRRRQRRLVYRFEGDAEAHCFTDDGHVRRGWSTPAPPASAWSPRHRWRSAPARRCCCSSTTPPAPHTKSRSRSRSQLPRGRGQLPRRRHDPRHRRRLTPATDGVVLRRLQPRAPARAPARRGPVAESEAIVVSLDEYRDGSRRSAARPGTALSLKGVRPGA